MRRILRFLFIFLSILTLLALGTLTLPHKKLAREQSFYGVMMDRLDSIASLSASQEISSFSVGYASISLTPDSIMPLAGYGARKPKAFDAILDSVFVRSIVIKNESSKVALVTADLLIIHPEIRDLLIESLPSIGWSFQEIYLSATHTHSSIGQWAPGLVGGLFAGEYHEQVAERISQKIISSILEAENKLAPAHMGITNSHEEDLVLNRLVGDEGIEDDNLKSLQFTSEQASILYACFSAHATCLPQVSRNLSGDYPSYFHKALKKDSNFDFTVYAAGAVASMGPEMPNMDFIERPKYLGNELAKRVTFPSSQTEAIGLSSFQVPLELGEPQFKIDQNLILRPYLFNYAFGAQKAYISYLKIGNTLLIGTPCDFSGELAVPLYRYAEAQGLNLMITSFNGGYIGYVTKDEWYDLKKYETLTMNWFGKGNGQYFSAIIEKLIDIAARNP